MGGGGVVRVVYLSLEGLPGTGGSALRLVSLNCQFGSDSGPWTGGTVTNAR